MSGLQARMASGAATVCRAWVLTRRDGRVFGFTDHDEALVVDGVACVASSGLTAGALERANGLSVDNVEASGALSHDGITEADLRVGRWDDAGVAIWLVDWLAPEHREVLFRGTLGEIGWGGGAFTAELRGRAEALNRVRGRAYQAGCDAVLGDGRCGVDLGDPAHVAEAVLEGVGADGALRLPALGGFAEGWFLRGRVLVLDGPAEGLSGWVKADRLVAGGRRVTLWSPLGVAPRAGDRVRITAGCDKHADTCREKFGNLLNFRGFPTIPGEDWLMAYPAGQDGNDGGRL